MIWRKGATAPLGFFDISSAQLFLTTAGMRLHTGRYASGM